MASLIETPQVLQVAPTLYACVALTVPREQIQHVMGPGLREVHTVLAAQGIAPAGPWFTHHLRVDPAVFELEICVPVAQAVRASGRVRPGELRAATVARTRYRGPYEQLGAAWGEFMAWIAAAGHTPAVDLWECYLAGPEASADPRDWCTELNRPLIVAPAN